MINGRAVPTRVVLVGLAKELGSHLSYLQMLATEIKPRPQSPRMLQAIRPLIDAANPLPTGTGS
jgi:hypothetical protein